MAIQPRQNKQRRLVEFVEFEAAAAFTTTKQFAAADP
jgi:hypothetical protein